ncbi:transposase [Streptomyces sp. C11-1]|uniref:Transposase n=1 Tax=Streptomyces durocortorensis TaxID=2811104 RepID=A0ABY9W4I7_9ACTN|nr:transposase [Streptomyces durocortorensis]WNF31062.1 transposase [Streptomyces durocortorensis]
MTEDIEAPPGSTQFSPAPPAAETGGVTRIPGPGQLCSWAGTAPKHHQSDTKPNHGRTTKQRNPPTHWARIQAARGGRGDPDADPALVTGYKATRNRPLTRGQKLSDKALAAVRGPVERGFTRLKNWRVLGKVRTDPSWATAPGRALPVLTNREVSR